MFGSHYIQNNKKCLADNRTAKYEASVGPAENLSPSVGRISKTLILYMRLLHYYIFLKYTSAQKTSKFKSILFRPALIFQTKSFDF